MYKNKNSKIKLIFYVILKDEKLIIKLKIIPKLK